MQSNIEPLASPEKQKKGMLFMDLGGAFVNQKSIGGN